MARTFKSKDSVHLFYAEEVNGSYTMVRFNLYHEVVVDRRVVEVNDNVDLNQLFNKFVEEFDFSFAYNKYR